MECQKAIDTDIDIEEFSNDLVRKLFFYEEDDKLTGEELCEPIAEAFVRRTVYV